VLFAVVRYRFAFRVGNEAKQHRRVDSTAPGFHFRLDRAC
jgi:hypothetical protein